MMSHELRTPLHGIISISDLLRGTAASPKQREMIRIISTSSNSLLELINRVLDISKFESKSIALQQQPMDLHEVVNDTANILWPQALEKGLALQVYIDPEIHNALIGSPHQLQEVLINLCGNAVKFTEAGQVAVRVLYKGETEDTVNVRFEISDTGPGIPKHALANIFEPFVQSDSPMTRKHGGTGLGTAFAKELIRLMDGHIDVESTEGVGTKFTIDVDLQKLLERDEVSPLYPFTVAGIGFDEAEGHLATVLAQFGTKIVNFPTAAGLSEFKGADKQGTAPDAIFVNADQFAENLGGVVRTISTIITDRIIPVYACGQDAYRSSAIAAGYAAYIADLDDKQLVSRTLNMISALRHDATEQFAPSADSVKGLHILVAEDNPTNQRIAQMVLEDAGHRCTIVGDGDEALEALHEGTYDLAILDMHMPHRDGIEVAKVYNFSHFEADSRIPLIMMTADSRVEAREEARASGIDAFVTKPITPRQLVDVIDAVAAKNDIEDGVVVVSDTNSGGFPYDSLPAPEQSTHIGSDLLNAAAVEELISYMDEEERASFFEDFITDGSSYIASLIDCDEVSKVQAARDAMHAFAGACLVIGAEKLAKNARDIEMAGTQRLVRDHTELHDNILATFAQTTDGIRALY
jgi:two-component system sensor histidine kinase RpfC